MGMYAKYVLPRFIDLAMRNKDTTRGAGGLGSACARRRVLKWASVPA